MNSPYTASPLDAMMAAQTSVGMTLTALLWKRPLRPRTATFLVGVAVWSCILLPVLPAFLEGLGVLPDPERNARLLRASAAIVTIAAVLTRRPGLVAFAASAEACLWWLTGHITASDWELDCAHVCAFGIFIGLAWHAEGKKALLQTMRVETFPVDDLLLLAVAVVLGAIVSTYVLQRYTNSGDEWAYTFQAALFAKGRAYGDVPRCANAFQAFWVFEYSGRLFAQYTPGWPYFMTPFVWLRAVWLAGPFSLGLLAVGVARLSRRALATGGLTRHAASRADVRAAGWFAGGAIVLGSTVLINGGSRYPHVFVAACFAWSLEALCAIADPSLEPRAQWRHGALLGTASALLLASRPADGAMLGVGIALFFVVALARRRIGLRGLAGTILAFGAWAGLTLVILRLQLGKWFMMGYSLNPIIHPWNKIAYSMPHPSEFKWGFPLATGSYSWWPCAPALGLAGLAAMRGHARRIAFVCIASLLPFLAYYTYLELGRGFDFGYGPRYQFPAVVPMAVGGGAMLGALWAAARRTSPSVPALARGGPAALAIFAMILGVLRIAPLVYPHTYADVKQHNRLRDALKEQKIHDAVVFVGRGLTNTDALDLTENWPLGLYENDVIVALDGPTERSTCVRSMFPKRAFYRAIPGVEIRFQPM